MIIEPDSSHSEVSDDEIGEDIRGVSEEERSSDETPASSDAEFIASDSSDDNSSDSMDELEQAEALIALQRKKKEKTLEDERTQKMRKLQRKLMELAKEKKPIKAEKIKIETPIERVKHNPRTAAPRVKGEEEFLALAAAKAAARRVADEAHQKVKEDRQAKEEETSNLSKRQISIRAAAAARRERDAMVTEYVGISKDMLKEISEGLQEQRNHLNKMYERLNEIYSFVSSNERPLKRKKVDVPPAEPYTELLMHTDETEQSQAY